MIGVSVVIPCYNAEEYVAECVHSVLTQTYESLEVICVDDGSVDGTLAVLESLQSEFPEKIRVVHQKNSGACSSRNAGMKLAKGEYIQFLDADDRLMPAKIERQVELMGACKRGAFIAANYVRKSGSQVQTISVMKGDVWSALLAGRLGCTCSNLFCREDLMRIGGWNESLKSSQESDLMFRLLKSESEVIYDELINTEVIVRSSGSISLREPSGNLFRFIELRLEICDWLTRNNLLTNDRRRLAGSVILGAIRMLYRLDGNQAVGIFEREFKKRFEVTSGVPNSRFFVWAYRLFGFSFTQRMFRFFGK